MNRQDVEATVIFREVSLVDFLLYNKKNRRT